MKITLNWLRELVDVVLGTQELCEALTMAGIEVESVDERRPVWRSVEVAEVVKVDVHPNADRLKICTVRTGAGMVRVVCGASNMQAGDHVAWAPPGTDLPAGRRIERATIRGQPSEGMLCSASELSLAADDDRGILILAASAPVGTRVADFLATEDTVLELAVTPNRGDCLSVLGIAREVAAITGVPLKPRAITLPEEAAAANRFVRVEVEAPDLCPRYCARVLHGVRVGPSLAWMQTRLEMIGLRPISNVVDATNYVMLERGQPLHAFDRSRVAEGRIIVRRAGDRTRFTTLDGVERELDSDDLVIADLRGPIALAGVMGGADSEIRESTTDVILESAFFTPETVRRTARRLGMASESSYRFERGVDPAGTAIALDRVAELILASAGGTVAKGRVEQRARGVGRRTAIRLRPVRVNALLGSTMSVGEMARPLRALGAAVTGRSRTALRVVPPTHRFDLESEIDLVEEVARISGYDAIAATSPTMPLVGPGPGAQQETEERVRQALRASGLNEMVISAFESAEDNRIFSAGGDLGGEAVSVLNPSSVDMAELRVSLLPGLLRVLDENRRHGEPVVAGYTLGRAFAREGDRYHERQQLAVLLAGCWPPAAIGDTARACDFGDLKGAIDLVLARLHLDATRWEAGRGERSFLHPGKSARVTIDGVPCGFAGALHPAVAAARGLDVEVWLAELDMIRVVQYCPRRVSFRPLPRFPAIQRDVAVVVDASFQAQQILDAIREIAEPLVEEVRVFDQYAGAPIPDGRKSLAYSIAYRAANRTLTDDEVNALHDTIVRRVVERLPVEVRR